MLLLILIFSTIVFIDFLRPVFIYFQWFRCLKSIRLFLRTIEIHQQWLIKIHGFQLIRPTSSLFEQQLCQLREDLFKELRRQFLFARQIGHFYANPHDQLISSIDLNEFGPLMNKDSDELRSLTNDFDPSSINSMLKLCHLQVNEMIQLIARQRPHSSWWTFSHYDHCLVNSIDHLNQSKQNCSRMTHSFDLSSTTSMSNRFTPWYFLLRSSCEQLFDMNERPGDLQRIIQDLKTVIYSLEALQNKPMKISVDNGDEQIDLNVNPSSPISSFHRFDDQIDESIDEILVGETGRESDEEKCSSSVDHHIDGDQRLLREQTHCLMKELHCAIQGKKREWNEREQRVLGDQWKEEEVKPRLEMPLSRPNPFTMLEELKETFSLNIHKLQIDEDIFGEDD